MSIYSVATFCWRCMGIQVQFLSRFLHCLKCSMFWSKIYFMFHKWEEELGGRSRGFFKNTAARFWNSLALFSAWCITSMVCLSRFDLCCCTNSRTKSWIFTKFKKLSRKNIRSWCLIVCILSPLKNLYTFPVLLVNIVLQDLCFWQPGWEDGGGVVFVSYYFPSQAAQDLIMQNREDGRHFRDK